MKRSVENIRMRCQRTLATFKDTLGEGATVSVDPHNLSGRPCLAALRAENDHHKLDDAPIFPLDGCVSPETCMCVYNVRNLGE